jgi:Na+/proline symporter
MSRLHPIDIAIIGLYAVVTIGVGFWLSKRASKSIRNYFLGGNSIPWYALGLSNASGMFDISGTMWMVYLLFVYGLKSVWIPWLWPVFNQIFMMVFLSVWLRRSRVMTGAEWIRFRFGEGLGARLAHLVVVAFAIVNVIGFLAYGFLGVGKFAATFLPWQLSTDPITNVNLYGLIITAITTLYVVKGGMFSVVFTEVLQFLVMTVACVWVGFIAIQATTPEAIAAAVPDGWDSLWFGWRLDLDWTGRLDAANSRIAEDGMSLFTICFMLMIFKGYLASMAGPAPNYDMQRVLSSRTPRDAARMSCLVNVVLYFPRYMLVAGLAVLALASFSDELRAMGADVDFELILPLAMREFIPVGLFGLLLSALLAAFMSTYAATVNAAPAYIVNDIYKRYLNPDASERTYVRMSYITSIAVVIVGTLVGLFTVNLNDLIQWIVTALYGGYAAANFLKWYWWRFNAYGYFWGMIGGILPSFVLALPSVGQWMKTSELSPIYFFPAIFVLSMLGSVVGSLLTPPDDVDVLKNFYRQVRPWGFWRPIHELVVAEHPEVTANRDFARDMVNVVVGIAWQTSLTAAGIFLVIQDYRSLAWAATVIAVTSAVLKFNWYDRLEDYPSGADVIDVTTPVFADDVPAS